MSDYRWIRPKLYRYRPADTKPRALLNRYPGHAPIGAALVFRSWCWCVLWARLGSAPTTRKDTP